MRRDGVLRSGCACHARGAPRDGCWRSGQPSCSQRAGATRVSVASLLPRGYLEGDGAQARRRGFTCHGENVSTTYTTGSTPGMLARCFRGARPHEGNRTDCCHHRRRERRRRGLHGWRTRATERSPGRPIRGPVELLASESNCGKVPRRACHPGRQTRSRCSRVGEITTAALGTGASQDIRASRSTTFTAFCTLNGANRTAQNVRRSSSSPRCRRAP